MPDYQCPSCGRPTARDASSWVNCGAHLTPRPTTVPVPPVDAPMVGWEVPRSRTMGPHEAPTRFGPIGAWLVVAFGVVIVAVGLIASTMVGGALGGPFYFAFYLGV